MKTVKNMGKIRQLDTQTANMIAAGEVVERPMGIVKELVENAIDAGSSRVEIMVEEGGLKRISVVDNGCGMSSEDAVMAFHRHATSKIYHTGDLWHIETLGFRGEALPSIASVSKLTMTTSDGTDATRVSVSYGSMTSAEPYPCNRGTEITVEGLFYQTPARLKHMRSAAYENSLIQDVIARFALSHPEISFLLISDGKQALRTTGQGNLLEVLYQIWGREVAEAAIPVSFEDFDYRVEGYIVKPEITRSSRNYMHVFLNGRMIKTYRLYKVICDGYEDFIVKGRYPLAVLNISADTQLVDVNVHPSKWEVRISKENQLEALIKDHVREALKNAMLAPQTDVKEARQVYYEPIRLDTDPLPVSVVQEAPVSGQASFGVPEEPALRNIAEPAEEYTRVSSHLPEPLMEKEAQPRPAEEIRSTVDQGLPEMEVIGQLHRKFILCAVEGGLAILDQHACQERVHYEEIRERLNRQPAMVMCLVPIMLKASNDLVRRADELNEAIADMHVTFEPFGPDVLVVREVPAWMRELEEERFLQDVLDLFKDSHEAAYARMEKKKIATMACHRSIRFNRTLTLAEMNQVVEQLRTCENPYHCPHGRPTFVILSEKSLTREFLR